VLIWPVAPVVRLEQRCACPVVRVGYTSLASDGCSEHPSVLEPVIASYQAHGHGVDVVEVVDDEVTWFR
jgi:hypothetical protein